MWNYKAVTL